MRQARFSFLGSLFLPLIVLLAGCGSTQSGSFTLAADSSVTLAQGQSHTFTVTPSSTNNFAGQVQISVSGLPAGVTVSPSTTSIPVGSTVTFTVAAASNAAVGTTTVTIQGVSGSLNASATVALTITAATVTPPPPTNPDFTLAVAPTTLTIAAGASQQVTLNSTAVDGFSGTVAVAVNGLPTGVTASPATISVTPGTPAVVTLTAASNVAATTTPVQVSFAGTSGSLSHSASVALTLTATTTTPPLQQDFTLTTSPGTLTLTPGGNGQITLNSTAINGFAGSIAVAVNNLPSGVTASPATIAVTPGTPFVVTLTAASNITATSSSVQVSFVGTSGSLSHTATIQLTLSVVADFSITANPNTVTLQQGTYSGRIQIAVTASNGFTGNVAFTIGSLPGGVTVLPPTGGTLQGGEQEPIVFEATDTATIGNVNVTITGTSGTLTHTATIALNVIAPLPPEVITLTLSPSSITIPIGSIGEVSVTASVPQGYTDQIDVAFENLPAGLLASPSSLTLTPGVPQTVSLIASADATAGNSTITFDASDYSIDTTMDMNVSIVNSPTAALDVPTWHYDMGRTGLYSSETHLTPTSVKSATFGKLSSNTADAAVDAQPLFLSGLTIASQVHNVLYVATENDTVYAYDADTGATLWQVSALGANETAADDQGCNEVSPKVGITSTPVIDRNLQPNGAIFFVAMTKDSSGGYHHRLHALDLTTGAELSGSPTEITATYPANGGLTDTFNPSRFVERAALLLNNGTVYLSWAAPCRQTAFDYDGWVMAYSEASFQQLSVLDLTPNGSGGAIWMSGAGPAADADGNVFLATAKGTFDTTLDPDTLMPINGDYGNGFVKIQQTDGVMSVFDFFEPLNGVPGSANYQDQGSGGVLLAPDLSLGAYKLSLAYAAGMDGNIYEMSRTGSGVMGGYDGANDNNLYTKVGALPHGASSTPAYFNKLLYSAGIGDAVKSFSPQSTSSTPITRSTTTLGSAGATPVISANGTSNAIVWALDTEATGGPVLHAYSATNLATELYNSTQASGARDAIHTTGKYSVPIVVNGHVYIGTETGVDVFGLLP